MNQSKILVGMGDILIALRAPHYERLLQSPALIPAVSGAEMNVCVSCSRFGITTRFVGAVPNNSLGHTAIRELRKESVEPFVNYAGSRIGLCFVERGSNQRGSTVLYDRENVPFTKVLPSDYNWEQIFEGAGWFHITGITPSLSQSSADLALYAVKKAKYLGVTVSCDLNYRKKMWNYGKKAIEIMPEIVRYTDILIGNEEDIQNSLGITAEKVDVSSGVVQAEHYWPILKEVFAQYPNIKKIAISLRSSISADYNKWQGLLATRDKIYVSKLYEIQNIVDRVGGGDSFAAGLISGSYFYDCEQDVIEYAVAASCLKHSISGDLNFVSREEVLQLIAGDGTGRVQR